MPHRLGSRPIALALTLVVVGSLAWTAAGQNQTAGSAKRVLVFSGTGWFRHPEIPQTDGWLARVLGDAGIPADISETPKDLTPARLKGYQVLILNNANELTTLLDEKQRQTIADWYKSGRGLVALHAALVHQTNWKWFNELAGCDFNSDSDFMQAKIVIDNANKDHPSVKGFGPEFNYRADWTNHDRAVTGLPGVKVLFRVDESTYTPVRDYFKKDGKAMGKDHPAAWLREFGGGRFFYTELGHDLRSLDTAFGKKHVVEGVRWAMGGESPAK
jgi:uncharacterized protein